MDMTTLPMDESSGSEFLKFGDVCMVILKTFASVLMVIGGSIPYVFQYIMIHKRKNSLGFSLLVCLILLTANILRILFWFGKRYILTLLIQSIVMIITMIIMLEISVRMNRKLVAKSEWKSIWRGDIFNSFWRWNDLSSYLVILGIFTGLSTVVTALLTKYNWYVETLGVIALVIEATLGMPQLFLNFIRGSTQGMSVVMVVLWLIGDLLKTAFIIWTSSPIQFWICCFILITVDILILCQAFFYDGCRKQNSENDQQDDAKLQNPGDVAQVEPNLQNPDDSPQVEAKLQNSDQDILVMYIC